MMSELEEVKGEVRGSCRLTSRKGAQKKERWWWGYRCNDTALYRHDVMESFF
jgi:hypothetical protein